MLILALLCVLSIAHGALINVNRDVDLFLDNLNSRLVHSLDLRDFEIDGVQYDNVSLSDLSTLERDGNAWARTEGDVTYVETAVSLKNMQLTVGRMTSGKTTAPVTFYVLANSALITTEIHNYGTENCQTKYTAFSVNYLNNVYSKSPNPQYNNLDETHLFWIHMRSYFQDVAWYKGIVQKLDTWATMCSMIPSVNMVDAQGPQHHSKY